MKKICALIIVTLFTSLFFTGCGQNNVKQKETGQKTDSITLTEAKLTGGDSSSQLNEVQANTELVINPQESQADQGQVTFNKNKKTLFYYNSKQRNGIIVIDGKRHTITKRLYDKNNRTYTLTGDELKILTSKCNFNESESGDCVYGNIATVTVSLKGVSTLIHDINVQDCPDYTAVIENESSESAEVNLSDFEGNYKIPGDQLLDEGILIFKVNNSKLIGICEQRVNPMGGLSKRKYKVTSLNAQGEGDYKYSYQMYSRFNELLQENKNAGSGKIYFMGNRIKIDEDVYYKVK